VYSISNQIESEPVASNRIESESAASNRIESESVLGVFGGGSVELGGVTWHCDEAQANILTTSIGELVCTGTTASQNNSI